MNKTCLEIREISLNFKGLNVLTDVSFTVPEGEICALVGPNGAGKTSVLNSISRIYKPQKGEIIFEGNNIMGLSPHKIVELGCGRTFQLLELFPSMTVLENIVFGCHHLIKSNPFSEGIFWGGYRRQEIAMREIVEEIIDFMELSKYRKQLVGGLPYGVQKLVGVSRALAAKPRLLLLDEPSSGMTRQEKEDLARFLLRIKYEMGVTMLWVEHDTSLISDIADRVIVIAYGRKLAEGQPDEAFSDPQVVEAFLGFKKSISRINGG